MTKKATDTDKDFLHLSSIIYNFTEVFARWFQYSSIISKDNDNNTMEGHACSTFKETLKRGPCAILRIFKLDVVLLWNGLGDNVKQECAVMFYGGDSASNRTNNMTRKNSCWIM